ncbi:MAG: type II toxin-antitoxin system RelE/ParE family toxin [Gammaproteobacteria bacterium]|nr:type II toxin-antitoxin system RelE/ParE family toxin [Gammaproteobacteria bacterium]
MRQCRTLRIVRVFITKTYERAISKLLQEAERRAMEAAIAADPGGAPMIRATGGVRKIRWGRAGRGKRGGIRTIYLYQPRDGAIYLLTAYAKSDRQDLSAADRKALSWLVARIREEEVK